jgi:hypothetical protein
LPLAVTLLLLYIGLGKMDATSSALARRVEVADALWNAVSNSMLGSVKTLDRPVPQGYVPIRIGVFEGEATMVELCRVNFDAHSEEPWRYPMFRDLISLCSRQDQIIRSLGELARNVPLHDAPAGFIFHESRVGSTLLCNMLAADKDNIVYSESHPLPQVALHCPGCDRAMQVGETWDGFVSHTKTCPRFLLFDSTHSLLMALLCRYWRCRCS